jgi:hypothetical protein
MPRVWKHLLGILLLPLCVGATLGLIQTAAALKEVFQFWVPFSAGLICWAIVFCALPRPTWIYVLGHELTHILWAWLFGARASKLRVSARGGSVHLTRTNSLITLAPYFFPFHAALFALLWTALSQIWNLNPVRPVFILLMGATMGFHVTMTATALATPQSDIRSEGLPLSISLIWLGNAMVLLLGLALLSGEKGALALAVRLFYDRTVETVVAAARALSDGLASAR